MKNGAKSKLRSNVTGSNVVGFGIRLSLRYSAVLQMHAPLAFRATSYP